MTQHTPGPWKVRWSPLTGNPIAIEAPGDAGKPGAVGSVVRQNGIGLPSSDTAYANARLIAAAPELLAAIQSLLFALPAERGDLAYTQLTAEEKLDKYEAAVTKARAAIAKAEGR